MKITIDIPKEFEKHFDNDRFKDSLERIKADLNGEFVFAGLYERELLEMLIEAFKDAEVEQRQRPTDVESTFKHNGCCICGADKKMFELKCSNTKQTLNICWNCAKDIAEQHFSEQNVKYGRWKWDGCIIRCSVCNERPPDDWQTYFCPNCGARMEGEENE